MADATSDTTQSLNELIAEWCDRNRVPKDAMLRTMNVILFEDGCPPTATAQGLTEGQWLSFLRLGSPTSAKLIQGAEKTALLAKVGADLALLFTIDVDEEISIAIAVEPRAGLFATAILCD